MEEMDSIARMHKLTAWNSYYTNVGESRYSVNNRFSGDNEDRLPSVRQFNPDVSPPLADVVSVLKRVYCVDPAGRTPTPSAGNINKVELHLISYPDGLLHEIGSNDVVPLQELSKTTCKQLVYNQIKGKGWLVVFSADLSAYVNKYGTRSYRFVLLEAGHLCQALIQSFNNAGIATCPIGGFNDYLCETAVLSGLRDHLPLYVLALGYKDEN